MEITKLDKLVLTLVYITEYLQYCKEVHPGMKFIVKDSVVGVRDVEKIVDSFDAKNGKLSSYDCFTEIMEIIKDDEGFWGWKEKDDKKCDCCGGINTEDEKISKFHKEWNSFQEYFTEKKLTKITNDNPIQVFRKKCKDCGNEMFFGCGEDKQPNIGLRE